MLNKIDLSSSKGRRKQRAMDWKLAVNESLTQRLRLYNDMLFHPLMKLSTNQDDAVDGNAAFYADVELFRTLPDELEAQRIMLLNFKHTKTDSKPAHQIFDSGLTVLPLEKFSKLKPVDTSIIQKPSNIVDTAQYYAAEFMLFNSTIGDIMEEKYQTKHRQVELVAVVTEEDCSLGPKDATVIVGEEMFTEIPLEIEDIVDTISTYNDNLKYHNSEEHCEETEDPKRFAGHELMLDPNVEGGISKDFAGHEFKLDPISEKFTMDHTPPKQLPYLPPEILRTISDSSDCPTAVRLFLVLAIPYNKRRKCDWEKCICQSGFYETLQELPEIFIKLINHKMRQMALVRVSSYDERDRYGSYTPL